MIQRCYRKAGLVAITIFLYSLTAAQTTSTYVFLNPIYAFPTSSSKLFETTAMRNGVTYTQGVYGSYGSGFSIQGGVGKMINNYFGFEVAAEWLDGKKIRSSVENDEDTIQGSQWKKVNSLMIKPMLILRNSGDLLSFYSKLGLVVAVYSRGNAEASIVTSSGGQSILVNASEVTKIRPKVGFTAAFGISFRVSESVAITTELNGQMLSLPEKSGYYSQFNINGADQLPTMPVSEKSWNYAESISSAPGDPNKPGTKLYEPENFSYLGVSVGMRYYF